MKELLINGEILFLSSVIQLFILTLLITSLSKIKFSNTQRILYATVQSFIVIVIKLVLPKDLTIVSTLSSLLIAVLSGMLFLKIDMKKSVISTFSFMLISIPIELISGVIGLNIFDIPVNCTDPIKTLPVTLMINLWFLIIYGIVYIITNKNKLMDNRIVFTSNKYNYINIFALVLFIIPNISFYTATNYDYPIGLLIYNIISLIFLSFLSIFNTYKSMQLEIKKRDLVNSELHNKALKELLDSIRVFKHDYNNLIHAIGGYISCGDIKGLEKYYKGASKEAKRVNRLESISPIKINEPSVYGLIAGKFEFADSKGVDFNFESIFDYQKLDMPIYDFCKIFGILLDNAIEAAEEVDELKEVNVYVRENKLEGYQAFVIENTYANKDVDTEQIYEKDFSTKNRNSGIGLWEVRRIVNKFDNVTLTTSKNDDYFRQELYVEIISKEAEEESPKELSSTLDS